jgi:hypothetical protein
LDWRLGRTLLQWPPWGLGNPAPSWLGDLIFGFVVVALRLVLNERLGVLGGYSELVERANGRLRALGWKSFFPLGVVGGGVLFLTLQDRKARTVAAPPERTLEAVPEPALPG